MSNKSNYISQFSIKQPLYFDEIDWNRISCWQRFAQIRSYFWHRKSISSLFSSIHNFDIDFGPFIWICNKSSAIFLIFVMQTIGSEVSGFIGILVVQIFILILYGIFVRYDYEMLPIDTKNENITNDEIMEIERNHKVSYARKWISSSDRGFVEVKTIEMGNFHPQIDRIYSGFYP